MAHTLSEQSVGGNIELARGEISVATLYYISFPLILSSLKEVYSFSLVLLVVLVATLLSSVFHRETPPLNFLFSLSHFSLSLVSLGKSSPITHFTLQLHYVELRTFVLIQRRFNESRSWHTATLFIENSSSNSLGKRVCEFRNFHLNIPAAYSFFHTQLIHQSF